MKEYTKEDMINFAYWLRQGLTNIEFSTKEMSQHLDNWKGIMGTIQMPFDKKKNIKRKIK